MKYLQGPLFSKFREVIMGWTHVYTLQKGLLSIKERAENLVKIEYKKEGVESSV